MDAGASLLFYDDDTNALSSFEVGDGYSNLDGLSRDDRIRYDTPDFHGFTVSTSYTDNNRSDVALRYNNTFDGGFKLAAAGAWANLNNNEDQYAGSASLLHVPSGVSGTIAGGARTVDGADPWYIYGKLGYQRQFFDMGSTAFSGDIYYGENFGDWTAESAAYGIQVVQRIDKAGTELYLGGRIFDYDVDGADLDQIFTVLGGARVKF